MLKLSKTHIVRSLAFGLVLAVVGFCYATNTADSRGLEGDSSAGSRAVGSNTLHLTSPLFGAPVPLPGLSTYDLGDACFGSEITRYITAGGGVRPYGFGATPSPLLALPSTINLTAGGCLEGTVVAGAVAGLFTFQVSVTDSTAITQLTSTGNFQLNLVVCPPQMFRFAVDKINNGVLGQSYFGNLAVLGGNHTVTFSVLPNTLTVDGAAKGSNGLEAIGLSLASDGTITGRPLQTGHVTFVARAVDSINRIANDRSDTIQDQIITFDIEDSAIASTDYTTTSVTVKGVIGQVGKDSIKFSGLVNGSAVGTLKGSSFIFTLGGAAFEGELDAQGRFVNKRGGPLVFQDGSTMTGKVNGNTGQISGSVSKATLAKKLDAVNILDRSTRRYALGVGLCGGVHAADMLEFATKRQGDKFQLDYKLGKIGTSLGGAFQIIKVQGNDKVTIAGNTGVQWAAKFICIPRFGIDSAPGLDSLSSIRVRIGTRFNQLLTDLKTSGNGNTTFTSKLLGSTVSRFSLNTRKFQGQLLTQPLQGNAPNGTGIGPASDPKSIAGPFTLGIDLDRSGGNSDFTGEDAKKINRGGNHGKKNAKSPSTFHSWFDKSR